MPPYVNSMFLDMPSQNSPAEAGAASRLHRSASGHAATPTARCQGEVQPLTVLVSVAFARQRNGSGGSRFAVIVCLLQDTFFSTIHGHF